MDYLWLVITVLSLVAGGGLLLALIILRRLSGDRHPPVEVVVAGMVAIGVAAFLGVYLRILGIPRTVLPFRIVNSAAWGFAVYACLAFLLHRTRRPFPLIGGLLIWGAAFLFVHAPMDNVLLQAVAVLVLELLVGGLAVATGVLALRRAGTVKSVPWRIVQRGTGVALLVLVPANLVEFLVAMVLRLQGRATPDGFLFSLGYGVACAIIALALIRALRIGSPAGEDAPQYTVPESMVRILGITPREREIIEKLLAGHTDREIGELLFISPRTVDTHLRSIFRKCAVGSRLQLSQRVTEYREQL